MVKVTRYSVWGSRRGQGYILTPEEFSQLVTEDAAVVLGLSATVAQRFADTAMHVATENDRFSLGAHIRYSLECVDDSSSTDPFDNASLSNTRVA